MDFTIKTYRKLLGVLIAQGYTFQTFVEFLEHPEPRCIILRHDVEARYGNALVMAKIQHEARVRGSYYFRFLPDHFDLSIISEISSLGHEIGYHYDDLSHCKGDYKEAIRRFGENLETLRKIAPVRTICMEGAPLSKYDNRNLWGKHQIPNSKTQTNSKLHQDKNTFTAHYQDFGIIGEPYFDIDFSRVLYLTDTGRRWDGENVSVRDKVQNSKFKIQNLKFNCTADIINAAHARLLPDQIMFTFHPQRWTDEPLPWVKELVMQNVKNVVKRMVLRAKGVGRRAEK